ncbi:MULTISPECIES: DUF1127 domain-containing protein [Rhizobium]|uniref:YjiS-like domain-containing protein n=1 Tax=Rhizobium favelukesii TaxID=348824 RepID=W6R6V6_9HYPH|nr:MULTISPECIES: DUF1127 domain-containing protein [Rhizobium]UFS81321.1 DUF1127 domain-containing protein [Rhizobium sp. T136]CDM56987.1 protein of unknown function DUF1127 [Rhizobium favelukesii]
MPHPTETLPLHRSFSKQTFGPWLVATLLGLIRWSARKLGERRDRNALLELSDEQLKDIGLSRGQTESDVHIYSRHSSSNRNDCG